MSNYFSYFPTMQNDLTNVGQTKTVTNILRRFQVLPSVASKSEVYYEYDIQAGERPDTIAEKYYGDSSYAWIILHFNGIEDPIFDWPMEYQDFENYIKGKYGSIASAQSQVHEYRRILTHKKTKVDGTIVPERYVVIDYDTYNTLPDIDKQSISEWDWETEQNDKKRTINILDKKYLSQVLDEVDSILGENT